MMASTRYEIPKTEHAHIGWEPRRLEPKKPEAPTPDLTHRPGRAL